MPKRKGDWFEGFPSLLDTLANGGTVRQYNAAYEALIPEILNPTRPWWSSPIHTYDRYASEFGLAMLEQRRTILHRRLRRLHLIAEEGVISDALDKWEKMQQGRREELFLATVEISAKETEEHEVEQSRNHTPEWTMSNVTTGRAFRDLVAAQLLSSEDEGYRIVPNARWQRLADPEAETGSAAIPLSRGLRSFIEDTYLARHFGLCDFTVRLLNAILDRPLGDLIIAATPSISPEERERFANEPGAEIPHSPAELKTCHWCGVSEQKVKLTVCSKCLKVYRRVDYCSRDCQVADWKAGHKTTCGKPLSETLTIATGQSRHRSFTPAQENILDWLQDHPTAVLGVPGALDRDNDPDVPDSEYIPRVLYCLPRFVKPFQPVLDKLIKTRDVAMRKHDPVSIGVVSIFCQKAAKYQVCMKLDSRHAQILVKNCFRIGEEEEEVPEELERYDQLAREAIEGKEKWGMVKEAFAQLDDPNHACYILPSSSHIFLRRLNRQPDSFFPIPIHTALADLPFPHFLSNPTATLTAIRRLAYRTVETRGSDELAMGVLMVFVTSDKVPLGETALWFWEKEMQLVLGLKKKNVRRVREKAMERLPGLEGEEWEVIRGAIEEIKVHGSPYGYMSLMAEQIGSGQRR